MFSLGAPESKYALQKLYKLIETKGKESYFKKEKNKHKNHNDNKTMLRLTGIQNTNQKLQVLYTIKAIAKIISGWITDDLEYVAFFLIR